MRDFFHKYDPVSFVFPIDGDCLDTSDGHTEDEALYITPKIRAAENADITINGRKAAYDPDTRLYTAEIPLYGYRNTITAIDAHNGARADIVVYRLHNPERNFYLSIDDTILFLYDLTKSYESYPSMFDHPFLKPLKQAHDLYGLNVHLNLYYEYNADSARDFSLHKDHFDLSMMTDKYRNEFEANSDWLTLSYHSHSNYPDMPGMIYGEDYFCRSIEAAHREILRFAGNRSLIPATCMHWGNCPMEIQRVYRQYGYRIQFESFRITENDSPYLGYYGRDGLPEYIRGDGTDAYNRGSDSGGSNPGRSFWKDNVEDIIFCHTDLVLNTIKLEDIVPWLDKYLSRRPDTVPVHFMIHEEYFYPDYRAYIPDCGERILTAVKYLHDRGYSSSPIESVALE